MLQRVPAAFKILFATKNQQQISHYYILIYRYFWHTVHHKQLRKISWQMESAANVSMGLTCRGCLVGRHSLVVCLDCNVVRKIYLCRCLATFLLDTYTENSLMCLKVGLTVPRRDNFSKHPWRVQCSDIPVTASFKPSFGIGWTNCVGETSKQRHVRNEVSRKAKHNKLQHFDEALPRHAYFSLSKTSLALLTRWDVTVKFTPLCNKVRYWS